MNRCPSLLIKSLKVTFLHVKLVSSIKMLFNQLEMTLCCPTHNQWLIMYTTEHVVCCVLVNNLGLSFMDHISLWIRKHVTMFQKRGLCCSPRVRWTFLTLPGMNQTTALMAPGFVRITSDWAGVKAAQQMYSGCEANAVKIMAACYMRWTSLPCKQKPPTIQFYYWTARTDKK